MRTVAKAATISQPVQLGTAPETSFAKFVSQRPKARCAAGAVSAWPSSASTIIRSPTAAKRAAAAMRDAVVRKRRPRTSSATCGSRMRARARSTPNAVMINGVTRPNR